MSRASEPPGGEGVAGDSGDSGGSSPRLLEVRVEAALADVLVVSCHDRGRHFQGVLLDCSKRSLPFGVSSLHPAFAIPPAPTKNGDDDRLYSVSRRFVYTSDSPAFPSSDSAPPGRPRGGGGGESRRGARQTSKMTVRLRPRKVLCSECKGVCSEKSESVVRARKPSSEGGRFASLVPKLSRLRPDEITSATNGAKRKRSPFDSDEASNGPFPNPRTLKISFGEGEGTVVRLPALEPESADSKAARRASRKAKKRRRHKTKHRKRRRNGENGEASGSDASSDADGETPIEFERASEEEDSPSGRTRSRVQDGDIVWGKLRGFPWWPGRVTTVADDEGRARVAWFNSETTSLVPLRRVAPFLDEFEVRFDRKKRGPYREAVRQATLEAGGPLDPLAIDPPADDALSSLSTAVDVLS